MSHLEALLMWNTVCSTTLKFLVLAKTTDGSNFPKCAQIFVSSRYSGSEF